MLSEQPDNPILWSIAHGISSNVSKYQLPKTVPILYNKTTMIYNVDTVF